jgi:sulfoacetaldehyde dehydrogenase
MSINTSAIIDNTDREYVSSLFVRARAAQAIIENYSQVQANALCKAVARAVTIPEEIKKIGTMSYEESKFGDLNSKFSKLEKRVKGTWWNIRNVKSVGVVEEIEERGLIRIAKPVGVVAALVPSTQPEVTPVIKALFALKGRNAVVFAPHPRTQKTTLYTVEVMRRALEEIGAPKDLLICAVEPTIARSQEIMKQSDLIVATGGAGMVHSAYSSGVPAFGAGVGNSNVIVDETADIKETAQLLINSKFFDQSSGCSCENSAIVSDAIYDEFLGEMKIRGAFLVSKEEKEKLRKVLWPRWPESHALGRDVIMRPAEEVAAKAGFSIPEGTKIFLVEETGSGAQYPFSGEKLGVVLTIYKYHDFDDAVERVLKNQEYQGLGHSCGIHSFNEEHIMKLAFACKTTRVAVRQAMTASNSGDWGSGNPWTATLGCGTWGGNIVSENITVKHFINSTWVSKPIAPYIPSEEEMFGEIPGGNVYV